MIWTPYPCQKVVCRRSTASILAYRFLARKQGCQRQQSYARTRVCYTARHSGVGALRRQIVFNKGLHDGVHTGIGLEAKAQRPRRGEGPWPATDDPLDFSVWLPANMLHRLDSGGALQRCHHVADLHGEPGHNERTGVLERCRWEVMGPYKGYDSLAWR